MKRIFALLLTLACSIPALAQTAEEIVARMDQEMNKAYKEKVAFTMEMKIPILGTMSSRNYVYGDKMKMEGKMMGEKVVMFSDGKTDWTYNPKDNTIEIENAKPSEDSKKDADMDMLEGITTGYDVSIKKETDTAWYIHCKKSASNTEKDDPKTMDLVVRKSNYIPISVSTKMKGVTVTLKDFAFNVTEKQVTFNQADYPDAKVVDKR